MTKGLELYYRLLDWLQRGERGQTTAEYVAVTAVGVALAITVLWVVLGEAIMEAIGAIAEDLTTFADSPPAVPTPAP